MIIYFNKFTGEIYGTIDGRVHTNEQLSGVIKPSNVPETEVSKYIVSFKPVTKKVIKPIFKMMVDPETLEVNNVKVGEEEIEQPSGMVIDDPFGEFFDKVERGELRLYQYKFDVDEKGQVKGVVAI